MLFCSVAILQGNVAFVSHMLVMERSDKQTDRVEISPEQLAHAQAQVEVCLFVSFFFFGSCSVAFRSNMALW